MRKLKLFFACLLMAVLSIGQVWATEYELMLTLDVTQGAPTGTTSTGLSDATLLSYLQGAAPATTDIISASLTGNVYKGKGSGGAGIPQECLKIGKASGAGSITFAIANTYNDVTKVEITGYGWKTSTAVSVNSSDAQSPATALSEVTFSYEISGSKSITINSASSAFCATEIKLYKTKSGGTPTPALSVSPTSINFGTVEKGTPVSSEAVAVTFANLTGSVAYSGLSSPFTASGTVSATGDEITIAANTSNVGEYEQTLTIQSTADALSKTVTVTMNVVEPFDGLELTFPDYNDEEVSAYTASWTATKSGQVWNLYGFNNYNNGWAYIKAGRKSASGNVAQPVDATIETQVTDHAVGDIVVTVDAVTAAQITSHKLYVADNSSFDGAIEIEGDPANIAVGDITYTVPTANRANDLYYKLEYATAGTAGSNGTLTISKITYAYATAAPQKQSTGMAYADELKNHLVKVGASYEAPTLTNPDNLTGITYASSADAVVEVNETTGALTIKAAGKAVITASRAEDDTYKAGLASYTIYVATEAGTAGDPLSETSAKTLIDLGCTMEAHVHGTIVGTPSYNETYHNYNVTLTDGFQFFRLKDLGNQDFSSDYLKAGDELTAIGSLLKYNNTTYELAEGCYLTAYTEYTEPTVSADNVELLSNAYNDQAIALTYSNLGGNSVTDVTATLFDDAECNTPFTGDWINDIKYDNTNWESITFDASEYTETTADRVAYMKIVATIGSATATKVISITQAKVVIDYAELPFAYDGNGSGELPNGLTNFGVGTYSSSPAMKFDGTGDYIIIKINAAPGTLTYDIKGNSFSGGTFKVQQSEDGTIYTDVETYTTLGDKQSESKTLEQDTRYVKFIYTEKSSGNVALGNITILEYVAPVVTPTVSADPDEIENVAFAGVTDHTIDLTYENITDYETEVTVHPNADGTGILTPAWLTASVSDVDDYATVTYSVAANDGAARTAYIKVYTTDGDKEATTIIPISQAEYVAPFDGLELTFPDEGSDGSNVASYTTEWTATKGTQSWSIYGFNTNKWGWNPAVIKTGRKNNSGTAQPLTATIVTQVTDHAVGDIVVTIDAVTAAQVTSHKLYVADNSEFTNAIEIEGDPANIAAGDITYTVPTANRANDLYYKLEYATAGTGSSNGILTISKITYAYATAAPQKQSTGLAYADELKNHLVKVGASYAAPTLTNPNSLTGITYSSSDDAVVEVNETTGALTIKAAGKAVITASRAEDETYKVGSASYTIYVAAQAGTAEDPLTEASAKILIDLGCTMNAHVNGVVQGEQDATKFTVTLTGGMQFYKLKDLGNVAFESAYIGNGDEVTAVGSLLKYNNTTYELAEGCYLTSYTKYADPAVTLKQSGSIVEILNVAATSVANQAIDVLCDNYGGEITSVSAKLYEESTCETEITSGAWVTDITVNGTSQVTFNVANNEGDARQVWLKVTAGDGTDEASAVLTISQAKYIPDYATLPFEFNGGKADIANTGGMTQSGLGSDYTGSGVTTKLKFDNTGDNLIIHINEAPDRLTYDIKGNSFSGGTFKVQESEDGETYSDLATYTEDGTSVEHQLASTTRYIKFVYVEKSSGNIGLGNIAISKYVAPAPVAKIGETMYESLPAAVAAAQDGETVELLMDVAAGPGVMITTEEHKQIIIDFGHHTYCANSPVGSAGTQNQAFHFEKGCNITLQNGTITSSGDEIIMLIQNYGDLTLLNITLIGNNLPGTHRYVLSNNCGHVVIGEGTTITAKAGDVAFNVCVTNDYPEGTQVTVKDGATITGIVEYGVLGTIPADNKATLTIEGGIFDITWNVEPALAEDAKDNINVSGGTFNAEVPADYCAHGYIPEDNGSGQYGVYYAGYYERGSLTPGNYATICLPYAGKISGASLFDIEYYENSTLYLLEVEGNAMVAGRPYIFLPSSDKIEVTYTDNAGADAGSFNGLVGSLSLVKEEITANAGNYILYNNQYWYVNSLAYVGANRAYIHMEDVPTEPSTPQVGQAPRRRVGMTVHGEQTTTDIDALNAAEAPVKVLINGQMYILRGEKMYNVNGQVVK